MFTLNTQFDAELRKRIEAEIEKRVNDLGTGDAPDFAAYKFDAGYIAGLRQALELCEDTQTHISKQQ